MTLTTEKGEIELPRGFKFEITTNHPFFSDDGTASAPVTLPSSAQNRELLDFPDNLNRRRIYGRVLQGSLMHGIFFKTCKIIVSGASQHGGISASIALRESEMYAQIQDTKLPDIFTAIGGGGLGDDLEDPWYYYKHNSSRLDMAHAFTFFPVACDKYQVDGADHLNIINKPDNGIFEYAARTVTRGGEKMRVEVGYGLAPYFYLSWVLRATFEYFGYEVERNDFETDNILSHIVLLHPYSDLLAGSPVTQLGIAWNADAGRMVPTITVGELITFIRDKFGAFVSITNNSVSIRLFSEVATEMPDFDLTSLLREEISVAYPERSLLAMTQECQIESADAAAESLSALRETYPAKADAYEETGISGPGLFHVLSLGKYYQCKDVVDGNDDDVQENVMIGSEAMTFRRKVDGIDAEEEISPDDSYVPMVYDRNSGLYMPYIGESVHAKMEIDGKEEGASVPIMLCYARFYQDEPNSNAQHCQGQTTSFHYGRMDSSYTGLVPLTPEGIVPRFWEEYWKILASGAPEISCRLALTMDLIGSLDLFTPKLLNGVPVLIKSLKYKVGDSGADCEAVLQAIPMYDDIPAIEAISFSTSIIWSYVNTCEVSAYGDHKNGIEILDTDGLTDYTTADAPAFTVNRTGVKARVRKRWLTYRKYATTKRGKAKITNIVDVTHEYQEYFISKQS